MFSLAYCVANIIDAKMNSVFKRNGYFNSLSNIVKKLCCIHFSGSKRQIVLTGNNINYSPVHQKIPLKSASSITH